MQIDTFNAHMLKTFAECKKKFFFMYKEKITLPDKTSSAKLGENFHILADYFLKKIDTKKYEKNLSDKEKELFENFQNLKLVKEECFNSEYSFLVKIENFWLGGRVDAIFKTSDGKIIIADWKTGEKIEDKPDFQSKIYLYAIFTIFKEKKIIKDFSQLEFWYIYLSKDSIDKISYSLKKFEDDKKFLSDKIQEIIDWNEKKCPDVQKKDYCYTCNFKYLCYNYSILNKKEV